MDVLLRSQKGIEQLARRLRPRRNRQEEAQLGGQSGFIEPILLPVAKTRAQAPEIPYTFLFFLSDNRMIILHCSLCKP